MTTVEDFSKIKSGHFKSEVSPGILQLQAIVAQLSKFVSSTATTQDALRKLVNLQTKELDKGPRSFKQISLTYKKMLQVANVIDEAVPKDLNEEAMNFSTLNSINLAHIHLSIIIKTKKISEHLYPQHL